MRLFIAIMTAAAFLWLAVIVTIATIVIDNIVAVSIAVGAAAAVALLCRVRHRAHSQTQVAARRQAVAAGRYPAVVSGSHHCRPPTPPARPQ